MDENLKKRCESIDTSVFSSDRLYTKEAASEFLWYLARWREETDRIIIGLEATNAQQGGKDER